VEKVLAFAPNAVFTDTSNADSAQLADDLVGSRVPLADNVVVTQVVPLPTSRSSAVMRYAPSSRSTRWARRRARSPWRAGWWVPWS